MAEALGKITNPKVVFVFVDRLLDLVFPGTKIDATSRISRTTDGRHRIQYFIRQAVDPQQRNQLNAYQFNALKIILEDRVFWDFDTNLLALYGLPSSRDALRDWLTPVNSRT